MQPGSSDCFAGTCRIGLLARSLVKGTLAQVRFLFNRSGNGFEYLINFMSDRGYLGGVLGFLPEDVRLYDAHEHAKKTNLHYTFEYLPHDNNYPESVFIELKNQDGEVFTLLATSIGGGMVLTHEINGFPIAWQSDTHALLIPGDLSGVQLTKLQLDFGTSLVALKRVEKADGAVAWFVELSQKPDFPLEESATLLPGLLPVISMLDKQSQLFQTVEEWRALAASQNISFVQAAIEYEKAASGWSETEIWDYFEYLADLMEKQIHSLERLGVENAQDTPLLPIYGKLWSRYLENTGAISDDLTRHIITHAFSVNAKLPGSPIVPAPMGTGGGYLYSALDAVREKYGFSQKKVLESLVVAAALGAIAYTHTNAAGHVGCVGESGICCAMASGAVAWLAGGDGFDVEHAASMALQANIGIPCDPIAGGLEFPCITRTIRAAVTAPLYADMALAKLDPLIPYHEMLQLIEKNYQNSDPASLSGTRCGCNLTKTGQQCALSILHSVDSDSSCFLREQIVKDFLIT